MLLKGNRMVKKKGKTARFFKSCLTGLITGLLNGMFGSGGGTIAVPAMVFLLGEEEHKAHATAISIILPLTLLSAYFYVRGDFVDWSMTYKVVLGGLAGGLIGAWLLGKCPAKILRKVFGIFMIAAGVRMLLMKQQ
jgi:uncharacterized membrane protein YfcA